MEEASTMKRGRQKIEMKKVEKNKNRLVTFTKRRQGLFKKACELSNLCAAKTAVIVFSQNGKIYSCGDVDSVLDQFLTGEVPNSDAASMDKEEGKKPVVEEEEEEAAEGMGFWWEKTVDETMVGWLKEYEASVQELKKNVEAKLEEVRRMKAEAEAKAKASSSSLLLLPWTSNDRGVIMSMNDQASSSNGHYQGAIQSFDDQVNHHHHHYQFVDNQYHKEDFLDLDFGELGLNGDGWF